MAATGRRARLSIEQLEGWLGNALVPVEPRTEYPHFLRARLVTFRGQGLPSAWVVVAILGTSLILAAGAVGFALRLMLSIFGVLALLSRRSRSAAVRRGPG